MTKQNSLGDTTGNPLRVAVVGAGPSGFYAAQALTRQLDSASVDLIEKLPVPYGLVRYGVAPDHPKLKSVTRVYDKIASESSIRFVGNVELGRDIELDEIRQYYHAVIVTCGLPEGRKPGIDGQDLPGSVTAAEFVGWYNGHPDHQHHQFDFSGHHVAVIGNGNVALDVARILLRTKSELRATDISDDALSALANSKVTDVHVIGRRGPVNASFASKELREFTELSDCQLVVDPAHVQLSDEQSAELIGNNAQRKIVDHLIEFSASTGEATRRCHFRFFESPVQVDGETHAEQLRLRTNLSDGAEAPAPLDSRLIIYCIGYSGSAISTLPVDSYSGVVPNEDGHVLAEGKTVPGLYVAGWLKRGPTGLIGSNRPDSVETVERLIADRSDLPTPSTDQDLVDVLNKRGVQTVSWNGWLAIREAEERRGHDRQSPANKFTTIRELLKHASHGRGASSSN